MAYHQNMLKIKGLNMKKYVCPFSGKEEFRLHKNAVYSSVKMIRLIFLYQVKDTAGERLL